MNWRRAKKQRLAGQNDRKGTRTLLFQELEPRVLYSADGIGGADALLDEAKAVELVVDDVAPARPEPERDNVKDTPPPIDLDALGSADERVPTREVVFVDTDTNGYEQLVEDLINNSDDGREFDVVILDNDRDGIEQISEVLAAYESLDAVHIISHGDDGTIDLGNTLVDLARLNDDSEAIAAWAGAFAETGDFLIYGCNLAAGSDGEAFVDTLARLTDTDVAASDDLTGNLLLGGDWALEYQVGTVEGSIALSAELQARYEHVLAVINGTTGNDVLNGTTGDDVISGDAGNDVLESGGGNDQMLGEADDDVFRFAGAQNGDVITVDGGTGTDTIELTGYNIADAIFADGKVTIDTGPGFSFEINYSNIDSIQFADVTATVLTGDTSASGFSGSATYIEGDAAFTVDMSGGGNIDWSYVSATNSLTITDTNLTSGSSAITVTSHDGSNFNFDGITSDGHVGSLTTNVDIAQITFMANSDDNTIDNITVKNGDGTINSITYLGDMGLIGPTTTIDANVGTFTMAGDVDSGTFLITGDLRTLDVTNFVGGTVIAERVIGQFDSIADSAYSNDFATPTKVTLDGSVSTEPAPNDAPVIALPGGAVNYAENDPATIIDATATVSDPDSANFDTGTLTVDFTANGTANDRLAIRDQGAGAGHIQVSGTNISYQPGGASMLIGTFTGGTDGSTPLVVTFNAAADSAAVQALMRNITFENVSENPSELTRTVRFELTDGDGGTSIAQTESINVAAVNDDPANAGTMPTDLVFLQDTQGKLDLSAIDLSDVDANGGNLTLTITSDNGHLQTMGWPGVSLGGSQSQLILTGSLTDLNDFLNDTNSIDYEHATPGTYGDNVDRIVVQINDNGNTGSGGGTTILLGQVNIDITSVAPQIDLDANDSAASGNNFSTTWAAGGGSILIADSDAIISDANSTFLQALTVTLTNHLDGNDERFMADVTGTNITLNYGVGAGEAYIYLTGNDTVAKYQQVLRTITYDNTAPSPSTATRTITFQADDGANTGNIATTSINITGVPVVTTTGGTTSYSEQSAGVVIDAGITLVDDDGFGGADPSDQFVAVVRITGNYEAADVLGFTDTANIEGNLSGDILTLSVIGGQTASVADFEAALRSVTYYNGSDTPSELNRTISFTFDDGVQSSNTATKTVVVTALNDDPYLIGTLPSDVTLVEDTPGYIDLSAIDFADVDAGNGLIQVTLSTSNAGVLLASSDFDVIVSGSGTSTLTLQGGVSDLNNFFSSASRFQYQNPTTHLAGDNADVITVSLDDLGNTGSGGSGNFIIGTVNVDITPVNDAPLNTVPGVQSTDEDTALVFSTANGNAISVGDVDSGSSALQVTLTATNGIATLSQIDGLDFITGTGTGDATMTFVGTATNINAALDGLSYDPANNYAGAANLQIQTYDLASEVVGNETIFASSTTLGDYDKKQIGTRISIGEGGTVTSITAYLFVDKPQDVRFGLYTDTAGEPDLLLAESSAVSQVAGTNWYTIDIPDTVVTAGNYWIAMDIGKEGSYFYAATGGQTRHSNFDPNSGLEATWTSTYASNSQSVSVYANVTPDSATPQSDSDNIPITVDAVNDAPVLTSGSVNNLTVNEDSGLTSLGLGGVSYSPGGGADEAGQTLSYSVAVIPSASAGQIFLADGTTPVTTGTYTLAQIQGMQFRPADDWNGVTGFQFNVTDSGGTANGGMNGVSQFILITVDPVSDPSVISGTFTGAVVEGNVGDAPVTATGTISISDADAGDNPAFNDVGSTLGDNSYGSFVLTSGTWTYTLDQSAVQDLAIGEVVNDTITYTATDGSMQQITVAITGTNDAPVVQNDAYTTNEDTALNVSWWDTAWTKRQSLTFNNLAQAETLTDFPVLVKLNATNIDYTQTRNDGADLRFIDANGNQLAYEIQQWDEGGDSYVWVKVPQITGASNADSIQMYYGNASAESAAEATAVWDNAYVGVWHLDDDPSLGAGAIKDSSANPLDGSAANLTAGDMTTGQIGGALDLDGSTQYIRIASDAGDKLAISGDQITIEAWVKRTGSTGNWMTIVNRQYGSAADDSYVIAAQYNAPDRFILNTGDAGDGIATSSAGAVPLNEWQHLTAVQDGTNMFLYADGVLVGTATGMGPFSSDGNDIIIGGGENGADSTITEFFRGAIDEVRISNIGRSADWVAAQYESMTDAFIAFGSAEPAPALSGVLANDGDVDNALLSVTSIDTTGTLGLVTLNTDGTFSYDPNGQFESLTVGQTAIDTFSYTVDDGNGGTDTATVTITIDGVNDAPVDLVLTSNSSGGVSLNENGGNDAYFIADEGLAAPLSQFTVEIQFESTGASTEFPLISYNTASGDELAVQTRTNGSLELDFGPGIAFSTAIDYNATLSDGERHTLSVSWDSTGGAWAVYVDGAVVDSGTGLNTGGNIDAGGTFTFGLEQDAVGGGFEAHEYFNGTIYDARLFDDVRTASEIATYKDATLAYDHDGLVANWQFDTLSTAGVVTETVSGNNLTLQHHVGTGFSTGNADVQLRVEENAANGTVVGTVYGIDPEREGRIASLLASDPDLVYSAETGKFYKLVSGAYEWETARVNATSTTLSGLNGQLVTIRSAAENALVTDIALATGGSVWLGATDRLVEGEWRWMENGTDADQFWQGAVGGASTNGAYTNWYSATQPNDLGGAEDAARLSSIDGKWYDAPTTGSFHNYIVAWDADAVLDATDPLTYALQSQTVAGAFTVDSDSGAITVADGSLLDYEGTPVHSLTIRVTDSGGLTYDEAFTISLTNVNEAPVVAGENFIAVEGIPYVAQLTVDDLLLNDSDVEGDTLTVNTTPVTGPANGSLVLNADGTFTYTPNDNFNGVDSFVYEVLDGNGGTAQATATITVQPREIRILFSTQSDVNSSKVPGISSWDAGDVLAIGDPNLSFEPAGSDGSVLPYFDLEAFSASNNMTLNGLHFVSNTVTVGGANSVTLQRGDLLFVSDNNEVMTSTNSLAINAGDVIVFRPDAADDYSSGTFIHLLDQPGTAITTGITLVENDVLIGDVTLSAGTFLFTQESFVEESSIYHFTADDAGPGTTSGTVSTLISSVDIDVNYNNFNGVMIISQDLYLDGTVVPAGAIVTTLSGGDSFVGNNGIFVDEDQIFYLTVTTTTMGSGTTVADATVLFDGGDIGLNNNAKKIRSFTIIEEITPVNVDPAITLSAGAINYTEADPATIIDAGATVADPDSGDFDGGLLRVDFGISGTSQDRLAINHEGNLANEIGISGNTVSYGGVAIGTFAGGSNGSDPLTVLFNANATVQAVEAVIQNVTYENVSNNPAETQRSVEFTLTDGDGGTSPAVTKNIVVSGVNAAPVITGANDLTAIDEDAFNNGGTLVSDLISGWVADSDPGPLTGIAVIGVDNTDGSWEFSIDGGSTWTTFGTPSTNAARLLAANADTFVRFVPDPNWNGTVTNGITFHAWDQTEGVNGGVDNIPLAENLRDQFDTVSYASDDGSGVWTSDWIEFDDDGAAATGNVRVESGKLRLDNLDGGALENVTRAANLIGATSATLTFDYDGYGAGGLDTVAIEVSNDGGDTWTLLERMDVVGTVSGSKSFDLDDYTALTADMQIRLRILQGFDDTSQHINFDNVDVAYSGTGVGGSSAVSVAIASSSITVNAVNDAPVMTEWFDNAWTARKALTIDSTQVTGDVTDFPVLISLTVDAELAAQALANGDDIIFTAGDGSTLLAHEIEHFNEATGELRAWVKTDLSANLDTNLYLYYGNAAATNQENPTGVWSSNYVGVYHLGESPTGAAGELIDASGSGNHAATEGGMNAADSVATAIGDGLAFDGSNDIIRIPDSTSLDGLNDAATFSLWINWVDSSDGDHQIVMSSANRFSGGDGYEWASQGSGNHFFYPDAMSPDGNYNLGADPFTNGQWHHLAVTMDYAAKEVKIYVDGNEMTFTYEGVPGNWTDLSASGDLLWGGNPDRATRFFAGMMDEIRLSDTVRSQEWIQTEANNQSNPGAFLSTGTAETQATQHALTDINEDDFTSPGDSVLTIINSIAGDRITDPDVGAVEGIAVIGVDDTNGKWEYDADANGTWIAFDTVSDAAAVLLDTGALVRFVPNADYEGTAGDLTFRAWDQTSGANGDTNVNVSTNGNDSAFGSATATATLSVLGVEDPSVISGTFTGGVTEGNIGDAPVTATGTISISDIDADDTPTIADQASTVGDNGYGSFVLSSGTWTYTLDQSTVQNLDAGDMINDTITYTASDGNSQQITVTITGTDDASVISGTVAGAVTEGNVGDAPVTATGAISIGDVDADDTPTIADQGSTVGDNAYGAFVLSGGTWTYTLDQSAVQDLDAGDMVNDTITYTASDGNSQQITVTITGTDDASVITGTVAGAVTEGDVGDAPVTATGAISIGDVDADDTPTIADQGSTVGDNAYGAFVLSGGTWTYTLDQSAVQDLDAGDMVTDTITYTASDGNSQQITVTITGTDDASVISGTVAGAVTEGNVGDAPVTATGAISIGDIDADDTPTIADQGSTVGDNAYGAFVLSGGTWTYTLDQSAVQDLDAGDMVTDTITYTASDGNSQQITVTITGTDDTSVISGTVGGAVTEGNVGDAPVAATGAITIGDVDDDDSPTIADQASTLGDNAYGSFVLTGGTWTYTLDQSAVQHLDAGDMVNDTITYTASDGNSQQITVTIAGTDDASVITGTVAGAVNEGNIGDAPVTATGAVTIGDADDDDTPTIADQASTLGDSAYGSFVLSGGTWTYTLDQSAVQHLDAGDMVNDTITYTASDGNSQQITVTITGTDDVSVISGTVAGAVTEGNVGDAPVTATGTITIGDVDDDDVPTIADQASTPGDNAYGAFVLTGGTWTYTLDQSAVQDLDAGDMVNDTITYTASDGNSQQITVTITGADDASVISGTVAGAVTEGNIGDAPVTATGAITIGDADADDSPTIADETSTLGDNAYGSFVLTGGTWTYTLDQSAVQHLDAGDMVSDTITYIASDGNSQQITVTITGTEDASVITGTVAGAVNEGNVGDAPVTATGAITIGDADDDDAPTIADQASTLGDNAYGAFVLSGGTWTYTLDQSAVQNLDAGDMVNDTITYTASDGNSQQITVTITGTDDASVISGTVAGAVTEGNIGDATVTAAGAITIGDVDDDDAPTIADQASTTGNNAYGSFVLAGGTWTYTLDQSAVQHLDAGDMVNDTITYTASDGNSQQIIVTITGTDDASVISGTVAGAVNEGNIGDAPVTATGAITIGDVDDEDTPTITDQASTLGDNGYGSFVLSGGTWTYTLDQSAVQNLDAGDMVNDTITYTASDGNSQQITVTVTGTDDASVISGTIAGAVNEGNVGDAPVTATGAITIGDVDDDDNPTIPDRASTPGDNAYGSFVLAGGTWTYTLDQSAVQDLDAGDMVSDTITYTASDGNSQQITVTITGTDDASVISGTVAGAVTEGNVGDAPVTATGAISIGDVDADDTPTIADQGSTVGDNAYGAFVLSGGTWTYTLDQSAVQDLDAGDMVTDTITYTASDGNSQQITVTITGTDDASVISGTTAGAVNEGNVGDAPVTATGAIAIGDVDGDDSPTIADQASTPGDNAYGSFVLSGGTWTYTLDQSAVQNLDAGDMVNDTITYTASDGNSQQITVTITGTDDSSVISGTVAGAMNEGNVGDAPVTATGAITIGDVDDDDSPTIADQASTPGDNAYGSFVLSGGTWTYTLDQSAVQDLDAGDMVNDTITYTASDGNSQQITVTITGTDDASVITGTFAGAVTEGNVGDAPVTATGAITIGDVDTDDSPVIADQASMPGDNAYGSFVLSGGTWTYTLDQSAVQDLDAGDMVTDTITYTASDGNSQQITVTITGTDDSSVITGTVAGGVTEGDVGDAPVTATGTIAIADVDDDDTPTLADQASTPGDNAYGSFVLSSGTWTYTLNQASVQYLDAGDTVTDTITYTASDGNSQQVTITITGSADTSVITGSFTGAVTEGDVGDAPVTATGTIAISDEDSTPTIADQPDTTGDNGYGSFVLTGGTWTYTLDQSAVQNLDAGDMVNDTITYTASDGNSQQITVTITGTDDSSVITGTIAGAVTEGNVGDAPVTTTGSLAVGDVDDDDTPMIADQASTVGDNAYGSFELTGGTWTYTLNQASVQDLDAGDMVSDTITYTASDGNSQQITVTITGTDDNSVISGTVAGAVTEGDVGDAPVTATGAITIGDVDADDAPTIADQASTPGDNAYGSFMLSGGTWTYTLDQSAVQDLDAGDMVSDTITYTASDGNSQQITVTITGTDDASVITGTVAGAVTEGNVGDAPVTATGAITIGDVDADDAPTIADQGSTLGDNAYGSFVLTGGAWTYTLDQSAVQDLDAGDMVSDTITYTASDGNSQQITVTITGTDDASVISGTVAGAVTEGNVGDAPVTATGAMTIGDVDVDDSPTIPDQASTVGDNAYGSFVLTSGTWTYTLDQSAVQDLDAGDMVSDTITYTASDGNSQQITVTITGTDDASVITGTVAGAVTEGDVGDAPVTATGAMTIGDVDADDAPTIADQASTPGDNAYGSFVLTGGAWTYTLEQSAVQDLDAGDMVNDTITYTASDGNTQQITVTITGTDDASVITGTVAGAVTEGDVGDAPVTATGAITIGDVDADDAPTIADQASTPGDNAYGSFVLSGGTWTYTLNQSAVQDLDAGDMVSDTITYTASDGNSQQITVTITGTDDASVITGTVAGAVTEGDVGDAPVTATGAITIGDVDADDAPTIADQASTPGDNAYGSFVLSGGTWTYTLDQSAVQDLDAGDMVSDTITYTASDGNSQQITVTITGTDDASVITGTVAGAVTEGNVGDAPVTATGAITIGDVDADDAPTIADQGSTLGDNAYGSFVLTGGAWTYTLDQSAVQDLDAGDMVSDTITYTASDGNTQQITVTITGTNDASVITGTFTGAVNEGNVGDASVTASGTLVITDADADDAPTIPDQGSTVGDNAYGSFVLSGGTWTYTLNQGVVQSLDAGDTVSDTITVTASDGNLQTVTVTITGTDDSAVISGTFAGAVTEGDIGDAPVTATGTLAITDADEDDSPLFADVSVGTTYGTFDLIGGVWTYTVDQSTVQDLDAGDSVNDSVLLTASNGMTQAVTITLTGTDDASVVTGTFTGTAAEGNIGDAPVVASGPLAITDADQDDTPTFPDVAPTAGVNGYGSFALTAGTWSFVLDQSAAQSLDAGDSATDLFLFTASDGHSRLVTVTITGAPDAPTTLGIPGLTVNEDAPTSVIDLHAAFDDVEDGDAALAYSVTAQTNTELFSTVDNTGGTLSISYRPDASGTASFTLRATDTSGAFVESTFSVDVLAVNDAPTLVSNTGAAISAGDALALSADELRATDIDNAPSEVVYTLVSNPTGGTVQRGATVLGAGESFTQADIDSAAVTIAAADDAGGAFGFTYTVTDTAGGTAGTHTFTVTVAPGSEDDETIIYGAGTEAGLGLPEATSVESETTTAPAAQAAAPEGPVSRAVPPPVDTDLVLALELPLSDAQPFIELERAVIDLDDPEVGRYAHERRVVEQVAPVVPVDETGAEADLPDEDTEEHAGDERVTRALKQALDELSRDMDQALESDVKRAQFIMAAGHIGGASMSAGVLAWLLRAGSLMASVLSVMPLWARMDPLPVLLAKQKKDEEIDNADEEEAAAARILDGETTTRKRSTRP